MVEMQAYSKMRSSFRMHCDKYYRIVRYGPNGEDYNRPHKSEVIWDWGNNVISFRDEEMRTAFILEWGHNDP